MGQKTKRKLLTTPWRGELFILLILFRFYFIIELENKGTPKWQK
jgi:hypothetical protein